MALFYFNVLCVVEVCVGEVIAEDYKQINTLRLNNFSIDTTY